MATPRQVAQADWAREKMENITNTQNCWGNAHRSVPSPMSKGLTNWSNISQGAWWTVGNSNSAVSSSIEFRKQFAFLTAIHDTWTVADLVLRSRGCRDLGKNWATCHLNFNQRHLCNWKDCFGGFPGRQNHHCIAGVQLETNAAIGRKMSNEQSEKQNCPCATQLDRHLGSTSIEVAVQLSSEYLQGWQLLLRGALYEGFCKMTQQMPSSARLTGSIPKSWTVVAINYFAASLLCTSLDDACSHRKCVKIQSKMCQIAGTAWKNNLCTLLLLLHLR